MQPAFMCGVGAGMALSCKRHVTSAIPTVDFLLHDFGRADKFRAVKTHVGAVLEHFRRLNGTNQYQLITPQIDCAISGSFRVLNQAAGTVPACGQRVPPPGLSYHRNIGLRPLRRTDQRCLRGERLCLIENFKGRCVRWR